MVNDSLYHSLADSFRLDFFLPQTNLINPPAVTVAADGGLAARMASQTPPQAVWMHVDAQLRVLDRNGAACGTLEDTLRLIKGRAYPILCFEERSFRMLRSAEASCNS